MTVHLLSLVDRPGPLTERATRAASVKASLTPRFRFAEHSAHTLARNSGPGCSQHVLAVPRYRSAPMFLATFNPR